MIISKSTQNMVFWSERIDLKDAISRSTTRADYVHLFTTSELGRRILYNLKFHLNMIIRLAGRQIQLLQDKQGRCSEQTLHLAALLQSS